MCVQAGLYILIAHSNVALHNESDCSKELLAFKHKAMACACVIVCVCACVRVCVWHADSIIPQPQLSALPEPSELTRIFEGRP